MGIKSGDNIYLNYNNLLSVTSLYFHNDTSPDGASIKLDTATNDFTISSNLLVEGAFLPDTKIDPINIDQNEANDGDILTWDSDTSRWSPKLVSASKEHAFFYNDGSCATDITDTTTTLILNRTGVTSNTGVFSLSNNEITVNKTGMFLIRAAIGLDADTTERSQYVVRIERDTTQITAAYTAIYVRGHTRGSSGFISIINSVVSGDVYRLRTVRTTGSDVAYQEEFSTRLVFIEL